MDKVTLLWRRYRYFPYEREFAKREVEALLRTVAAASENGLEAVADEIRPDSLKRLTYFAEAVLSDGSSVVPTQALLEASSRGTTNGRREPNLSARQSTRYSAHGLHDYRGKFNPQVVRAVGNMLSLPDGAWVYDPFCGSGTTLLESAHSGWNAVGTDLNPLAVMISNAKVALIHADPGELADNAAQLLSRLRDVSTQLHFEAAWSDEEIIRVAGEHWETRLPHLEYLSQWFTRPVLGQLSLVLQEIDALKARPLVPAFKVILSDLARTVSLQDPGDLRIRRRKEAQDNYPAIPLFIEAVEEKVAAVLRAREVVEPSGFQRAFLHDSTLCSALVWGNLKSHAPEGFDAAITSPPYATALPYIDTQRLSLCLLGLVAPQQVMPLERSLIGTREIRERERKALELQLKANVGDLPPAVLDLCRHMLEASGATSDGFRRRNMPALIYNYFFSMKKVFRSVRHVVHSSGAFALVVGMNRTVLGGEPILIKTPHLLAKVAESTGWEVQDVLKMDTYQRFDIHQRNSIKDEFLLVLRNPRPGIKVRIQTGDEDAPQ